MGKKGGPSIKGMHVAFGIGSALLLLTTLWVFIQDHFGREFLRHQEKYDRTELQRLENDRDKIYGQLAQDDMKAELESLEKKVDEAKSERDNKQDVITAAKKDIQKIDDKLRLATRELNSLRGDYDEYKYLVDAGKRPASILETQQGKIDGKFKEVNDMKDEREAKANEVAKAEDEFRKAKMEFDRIDGLRSEADTKIKKFKGNPITNLAKDFPGLDIVAPRRHIDQVVLKNLPVDFLFAMTQRVDRCVTCHQAIDNPDPMYKERDPAKLDPVLRSHPRLELFVGANSKHSYRMFGCTICHQGRSMGVSFNRSAHSPQNAEQHEEWHKKYHYEEFEFWDNKMLPLQYTEASCLKCHKGLDNVPEAHKLNEGRELFRNRGCVNCHMGATGDKDMAWVGRVGPDLRRIGEKTNIQWARHWIENPWEFRATTKMPRFFGLENRKDLEVDAGSEHMPRDPVEVEAIASYIFTASQLRQQTLSDPPSGDSENGKKIFQIVGCVGCHSTREAKGSDKVVQNNHGPDLSRIGDKVSPAWLFEWIKHPRHYWPETKMPDLRLNDKEAADVVAYLMGTMKSGQQMHHHKAAPEAAFDFIISEKLGSTLTKERIGEILSKPGDMLVNQLKKKVKYITNAKGATVDSGDGEWTEAQIDKIKSILGDSRAIKAFYAGEMLIQNHGCYGCHNIQGWTYAPLTCVNLAGEGDKDLEKLFFGKTLGEPGRVKASIPHTKWDWFYTKIARPRVYDMGMLEVIKPLDRLRMPWFGFPKEAQNENEDKHAGEKGEHAEGEFGEYSPRANKDESSPFGLTHTQVERLVTHLLSLTNEPIPVEMRRAPSPQDIAIDRGHRVVRELNCTGCHIGGLDTTALPGMDHRPSQVPMESLVALLTPLAGKKHDDGVFADEDIVALDFKDQTSQLDGFINVQRGTYLTGLTVPILLNEKMVSSHALEAPKAVGFKFEKKQPKTKKNDPAEWVEYGELVKQDKFESLTVGIYFPNAEVAGKAYDRLKGQFVDMLAYERMAGTLALQEAGKVTFKDVDDRKKSRAFYEPASVRVRFTHGEGRIIPYVMKLEEERGTQNVSQQQAPPGLSFEGGKVQPDWLYQFLHNVHTLRTGLNVRMPSFWTEGPYSSYKIIYPAGHLSAVDPAKRDKGVSGEPLAGPDAIRFQDMPDDGREIVDFFIADASQKPYGYQSVPLNAETRKIYDAGMKLVTAPEKEGGMGCLNCHAFGKREPSEPKWAPNLGYVKRRLKDDWIRRFLTNPQAIYPWANMPNNFGFDWQGGYSFKLNEWHRGMMDGDEAKIKESADKIRAVKFFLLRSGDGELGDAVPAK